MIVLTALKNEIINDPENIGYAPYRWHDSSGLALLLNTPRQSGPEISITTVSADKLRSRVKKSEYDLLSTADKDYLSFLLSGETVDTSVSTLQTDLAALFPVGSVTRTNWLELIRKKACRAEELWGVDVRVRVSDIDAARDIL